MECISPLLLCILGRANVIVTDVQGEGDQTILCVYYRLPPLQQDLWPLKDNLARV